MKHVMAGECPVCGKEVWMTALKGEMGVPDDEGEYVHCLSCCAVLRVVGENDPEIYEVVG